MPSFISASGRRWAYDVDKRLGSAGGFGEVFLGTDGSHEVAVKRIPLRIGDSREKRRREREVEITRKLASRHDVFRHILVSIDWGMSGEELLLVMPRAKCSLADVISTNRFSDTDRYEAIREVALGLSELTSAGILHRDLKPANVLWFQGSWRLSDFGISRDTDASTATYTFNGAGSLPYMAPEVWELRPATTKTDLYALGVLAYEVISGSRPFRGPNAEDYERQHTREMPPPLPVNDGRMSRLITRLLNKDPSSRPQDAQAVVEVIDLAMRRLDSGREEVAEAAAAMANALSQRQVEKSRQDQNIELSKRAIKELVAFLEDSADDMRDVFPGVMFTDQGRYYWLHLDAAKILFCPIGLEPIGSTITACSVHAALPERIHNDSLAKLEAGLRLESGLTCTANLICDMIDNRLKWSVATFTKHGEFPCGYHSPGLVRQLLPGRQPVRPPSRGKKSASDHWQEAAMVVIDRRDEQERVENCKLVPLTVEGMMWLVRHSFQSLTHVG